MMPLKSKYHNNLTESSTQEITQFDTSESSPTIPVKDYKNKKYQVNLIKQRNNDIFSGDQNGRRKRKHRHEKINYERSPVNAHVLHK
mmetsp:Transcript_4345/g.3645  ORF Transcript_4345/g.3645 Transcript_4345/m.3645 type:complete len:87 (+) Transcript_4345:354-614(+)